MPRPTDKELEISIAKMLRFGIVSASLMVLAGAVLELRNKSLAAPDYSHFHAADSSLRSIAGIWKSACHLNPNGVIQLGLLLLIATPIARVVFCVIGFSRQRDKLYMAVSATVLLILVYSFARGGQ